MPGADATTVPKAVHCSTLNMAAWERGRRALESRTELDEAADTLRTPPRARTPVRQRGAGLVSDEVREEVR